MVSPDIPIYGNYLGLSQDARLVVLESDSTSDMAGGLINGGVGYLHCNPFRYTGSTYTSTVGNYIMAVIDSGYLKMVMLQVCNSVSDQY